MVRPEQIIPFASLIAGVPLPIIYIPALFPDGVINWCVLSTTDNLVCVDVDGEIDTVINTITLTSQSTYMIPLTLIIKGYLPSE